MLIYGISDLHLPGGTEKPMDVFGPAWEDHGTRIANTWRATVGPEDLVLSPGDLSWAMHLAAAQQDLDFLGTLPGTILLIKGNHDLWWKSISQLRQRLPANVHVIQNDFHPLPGQLAVCGTRGWKCPGAPDYTTADERVYLREVERLRLSLRAARAADYRPFIVMLHYPPRAEDGSASAFTQIMEAAGITHCVYGHLHGDAHRYAMTGLHNGIEYHLVSCDAIGFQPKLITELLE